MATQSFPLVMQWLSPEQVPAAAPDIGRLLQIDPRGLPLFGNHPARYLAVGWRGGKAVVAVKAGDIGTAGSRVWKVWAVGISRRSNIMAHPKLMAHIAGFTLWLLEERNGLEIVRAAVPPELFPYLVSAANRLAPDVIVRSVLPPARADVG